MLALALMSALASASVELASALTSALAALASEEPSVASVVQALAAV